MGFATPNFGNSEIDRAGKILANPESFAVAQEIWAEQVLANWRACHLYPINTFQATLRDRLKRMKLETPLVAQRLKRAPSIISKLQRYKNMKLSKMQDVGGLRAVLKNIKDVRELEDYYKNSTNFLHELRNSKDYLNEPKPDGYRSVHIIYRYNNTNNTIYNGLSLELQFRTRLQHAWATAVETMGIFLGQALKSGQGTEEWKRFFSLAGAALAIREGTNPVPGYENDSSNEVFKKLVQLEKKLKVCHKLRTFAVATDQIVTTRGAGAYHLIVLDSKKRSVSIMPFSKSKLEQANLEYSKFEEKTRKGEPIEAVLLTLRLLGSCRWDRPDRTISS